MKSEAILLLQAISLPLNGGLITPEKKKPLLAESAFVLLKTILRTHRNTKRKHNTSHWKLNNDTNYICKWF
jgi:hypothetical protein